MRDLLRAWRSFRSRPAPERARLLRRVVSDARAHGVTAALARVRQDGAADRQRDAYADWCREHTPDAAALARMREASARFTYQPLITIITPVYNTDPQWLDACADSVIAQAYPHWQWSIGNDGSTKPATLESLGRIAARDPRIIVTDADKNGGIAAASNLALSRAQGEYVALMDSDDALLPHALFRMVEQLNAAGERADVLYSDEDKLDLDGTRCEAYFKPDWSPDLFLSNMFVCHLLMARRALIHDVGAFRTAFDFSQDYDLMLRLSERANRIDHVADILYHWRKVPQSGATVGDAKPAAHIAGRAALQDALDRRGIDGDIVDVGPAGFYRVKYRAPDSSPLVSVIVTGSPSTLRRAQGRPEQSRGATSLRTSGRREAGGESLDDVTAWPHVEYVGSAKEANGSILVFLGNGVRPSSPDWLDALVELALQPGVGIVGPRVLDAHGRIRDLGLYFERGTTFRALHGLSPLHGGYFGSGIAIHNVSAVSGACVVTPRVVWESMGGWADDLTNEDARAVDYALRVHQAGHRIVVTPWSSVVAPASSSREVEFDVLDNRRLHAKWARALQRDPFHNVHLSAAGVHPTS
ncbi:MAG: glycosyltransferase [Acidobacteria bacterium]|nr:glycosyltransferase [Acidobacteriota bacterium]